MASLYDQLNQSEQTEGLSLADQAGDNPSNIGTFMAGIGSGLFKIPEGIVSLGAT